MLRQRIIKCFIAMVGSAVQAFGLYNVHSVSGVTEGGGLGLTLLLQHWIDLSPAVTSFAFNMICYGFGWKTLGRGFLLYSFVSAAGFSVFYAFFEQFDPLWPKLAEMPLAAALSGALFVGVGSGLCVRIGGATGGDDALAMSISRVSHLDIQWIYFISDVVVLLLSLSYIPVNRIAWSLLTVILSGQLIGMMQKIPLQFSWEKGDS
ncbi:MAG: YitT family protein [Candidatus Choladocola sp.]|nr:YitT family protein [Candidatus Choladocola sp.]